jgi:hypothetical protein
MALAATSQAHPLRALLWALAVFGFLEFVVLRFVSALSFQGTLAGGTASGGLAPSVGAFCLDLATVLAFVCLLTFALTPIRWKSGWSFTFVGYVILGAVLPWATAIGSWVPATYGAISAALTLIVGLVALVRPGGQGAGRFAIALLVLSYVCAYFYALAPAILGPGVRLSPGGPGTLAFGEVLYLGAGVFAFVGWGWPRIQENKAALYGGLAAAIALALYLGFGGPSGAAAITSATGLTLFLPLWTYVLSTFFFASTALACLFDAAWFATGAALFLILVAGLLPTNSYQQALTILAMTLLAHGEAAFWTQAPIAPTATPAPTEES